METKNEIGSRRTYHRAPEGYRSPVEIGARLIDFLHQAAKEQSDIPVRRTVITVPASFQASQRIDTVRAAELAGLDMTGGEQPVPHHIHVDGKDVNSLTQQGRFSISNCGKTKVSDINLTGRLKRKKPKKYRGKSEGVVEDVPSYPIPSVWKNEDKLKRLPIPDLLENEHLQNDLTRFFEGG